MEPTTHIWEYVLLAFKIIGIVGAFAGFSAERRPEASTERRGRVFGYVFLCVAIAAELCDSFEKIQGANEQVVRFERLAHPLGSIEVTPLYTISLNSPLVDAYRKRVDKRGLVEPDPEREEAAYRLLADTPEIRVSIYKRGAPYGAPDLTPDIAFEVHFPPRSKDGKGGFRFPKLAPSVFEQRSYNYQGPATPKINAQFHDRNDPGDRYAGPEIISTRDLLGATVEISFCPNVFPSQRSEPNDDIARALGRLIELQQVYIAFPGRQEINIHPGDNEHVTATRSPDGECQLLIFKVPREEAEYRKLLVP